MVFAGEQNYTSAADLADMMERIRTGTMINKEISDQMLQIMACHQKGRFKLKLPTVKRQDPRKPVGEVRNGTVIVASKGGTLLGIVHEAAILLLPEEKNAVLVMLTTGSMRVNEPVMAEVAKTVYRALVGAAD